MVITITKFCNSRGWSTHLACQHFFLSFFCYSRILALCSDLRDLTFFFTVVPLLSLSPPPFKELLKLLNYEVLPNMLGLLSEIEPLWYFECLLEAKPSESPSKDVSCIVSIWASSLLWLYKVVWFPKRPLARLFWWIMAIAGSSMSWSLSLSKS